MAVDLVADIEVLEFPDVAVAHGGTPLHAPTCPLCGQPNGCAAVAAGSFAVDCWCQNVAFDPGVLARVPPESRAQACICRRCAEGPNGGWC